MSRSLPSVGPMERALQLRSLPPFRNLAAGELAACAQLLEEVRLRRNVALYGPREGVKAIFLLVEGRVQSDRSGRVIETYAPPAIPGLVELLAGHSDIPRAVTQTSGLALAMDSVALFDLMEDHFNIYLGVRRALSERLAEAQGAVGDLASALPSSLKCSLGKVPGADGAIDPATRLLLVQRSPIFKGVNLTALAALTRDREDVELHSGDTLWQAGDPADALFVVAHGDLECRMGDSKASTVVGAGTLLGAESVLGGAPHSYSARARAAVTGFRIEGQMLLDLAEDDFDLAQRGLALLAREILRLRDMSISVKGN